MTNIPLWKAKGIKRRKRISKLKELARGDAEEARGSLHENLERNIDKHGIDHPMEEAKYREAFLWSLAELALERAEEV